MLNFNTNKLFKNDTSSADSMTLEISNRICEDGDDFDVVWLEFIDTHHLIESTISTKDVGIVQDLHIGSISVNGMNERNLLAL